MCFTLVYIGARPLAREDVYLTTDLLNQAVYDVPTQYLDALLLGPRVYGGICRPYVESHDASAHGNRSVDVRGVDGSKTSRERLDCYCRAAQRLQGSSHCLAGPLC